jgi:hypothetical protein
MHQITGIERIQINDKDRYSYLVKYSNGAILRATIDRMDKDWIVSGVALRSNCPTCKKFDDSNCRCIHTWLDKQELLRYVKESGPDREAFAM